jgi:hypothetical protein
MTLKSHAIAMAVIVGMLGLVSKADAQLIRPGRGVVMGPSSSVNPTGTVLSTNYNPYTAGYYSPSTYNAGAMGNYFQSTVNPNTTFSAFNPGFNVMNNGFNNFSNFNNGFNNFNSGFNNFNGGFNSFNSGFSSGFNRGAAFNSRRIR